MTGAKKEEEKLTEAEQAYFKDLLPKKEKQLVEVRNAVIEIFEENPTAKLHVGRALQFLRRLDPSLVSKMFVYLENQGRINFGAIEDVAFNDLTLREISEKEPVFIYGKSLSALLCAKHLISNEHNVKLIYDEKKYSFQDCICMDEEPSLHLKLLCKQTGAEIVKLNVSEANLFNDDSKKLFEFLQEIVQCFQGKSDGSSLDALRTGLTFQEPKNPIVALENDSSSTRELFQRAMGEFEQDFEGKVSEAMKDQIAWRIELLDFSHVEKLHILKGVKALCKKLFESISSMTIGKAIESVKWEKNSVEVKYADGETEKGCAIILADTKKKLERIVGKFDPAIQDVKIANVDDKVMNWFRFGEKFWEQPKGSESSKGNSLPIFGLSNRSGNFGDIFVDISSQKYASLLSISSSKNNKSPIKMLQEKFSDKEEQIGKRVDKLSLNFESTSSEIAPIGNNTIFFAHNGINIPSYSMSNAMRVARVFNKCRQKPVKRKLPETFGQPPAKRKSVPPKSVKAMDGSDALEKIREAQMSKIVKVDRSVIEGEKSKLLNGLFSGGATKSEVTKRGNSNLMLTAKIDWKSPKRPEDDQPSPTLPSVSMSVFSDDESSKTEAPPAADSEQKVQSQPPSASKSNKRESYKDAYKEIMKHVKKAFSKVKHSSSLKSDTRKTVMKKASKRLFEDYKSKMKKRANYTLEDFMTKKRKEAIRVLVKKYVKAYK